MNKRLILIIFTLAVYNSFGDGQQTKTDVCTNPRYYNVRVTTVPRLRLDLVKVTIQRDGKTKTCLPNDPTYVPWFYNTAALPISTIEKTSYLWADSIRIETTPPPYLQFKPDLPNNGTICFKKKNL